MKRILFLDVDGVLNSTRTQLAFGGYPHDFSERDMGRFDPVALALVRKLCDITGAVVVLSTTWRLNFTLEEVEQGLELPIVGATPDLGGDYCRADEIAMWLATAKGVTHYAIVDDLALDFEDPRHALRFVQTNEDYGLSVANYRQLFRLLNDGPPP
jgi:hypothetical protein